MSDRAPSVSVPGFLFWASIPGSIILSSWVPFGVGLLILLIGVTWRNARQAKRGEPRVINVAPKPKPRPTIDDHF